MKNANTYLVGILDTPQWRRFHLGAKWMTNQKFYLAGGVGGNETQYVSDNRLLIDAGCNKLTMDAGLYDVVAKQFMVNSGSAEGGFLAGPELKGDRGSGFVIVVR